MMNRQLVIAFILVLVVGGPGWSCGDEPEPQEDESNEDDGNNANNNSEPEDCEEGDWTALPSDEVKCCPGGEIDCDIVKWDDETYYDPATSTLQFVVDGEVTEVDYTSISYSITDGSGMGGRSGSQEGEVQDGTLLTFDLSEVELEDNETFELGSLRIEDVCDDVENLMLDIDMELDGEDVEDDFECSVSSF